MQEFYLFAIASGNMGACAPTEWHPDIETLAATEDEAWQKHYCKMDGMMDETPRRVLRLTVVGQYANKTDPPPTFLSFSPDEIETLLSALRLACDETTSDEQEAKYNALIRKLEQKP